ncbi:Histone deacetylase 6 [Bienertia sinuspersici]
MLNVDCDRSWMHIKGIHGRQKKSMKRALRNSLSFLLRTPSQVSENECDKQTVKKHLFQYGMDPDYNPWIYHGEGNSFVNDDDPSVSKDMAPLVHDVTNVAFDQLTSNNETKVIILKMRCLINLRD